MRTSLRYSTNLMSFGPLTPGIGASVRGTRGMCTVATRAQSWPHGVEVCARPGLGGIAAKQTKRVVALPRLHKPVRHFVLQLTRSVIRYLSPMSGAIRLRLCAHIEWIEVIANAKFHNPVRCCAAFSPPRLEDVPVADKVDSAHYLVAKCGGEQ